MCIRDRRNSVSIPPPLIATFEMKLLSATIKKLVPTLPRIAPPLCVPVFLMKLLLVMLKDEYHPDTPPPYPWLSVKLMPVIVKETLSPYIKSSLCSTLSKIWNTNHHWAWMHPSWAPVFLKKVFSLISRSAEYAIYLLIHYWIRCIFQSWLSSQCCSTEVQCTWFCQTQSPLQ